jgi:acetyl-CoA synthetase
MENHFTVEEAARSLKLTVDTVRRWLRDGTIHGRKLGRVWRIPESELQRLGNEQRIEKDAETP